MKRAREAGALLLAVLTCASVAMAATTAVKPAIRSVKVRRGGSEGSYEIVATARLTFPKGDEKGYGCQLRGKLRHASFNLAWDATESFRAPAPGSHKVVSLRFPYAPMLAKLGKKKAPQSVALELEVSLHGNRRKPGSAQRIWRPCSSFKREVKWPLVRDSVVAANFYNVVTSTWAKAKIAHRKGWGAQPDKKKRLDQGMLLMDAVKKAATSISSNKRLSPSKKADQLEKHARNAQALYRSHFSR